MFELDLKLGAGLPWVPVPILPFPSLLCHLLFISITTRKANILQRQQSVVFFFPWLAKWKKRRRKRVQKGKRADKPCQQINTDLFREEPRDSELPVISGHHSPKQNQIFSPSSCIAIEMGSKISQAVLLKQFLPWLCPHQKKPLSAPRWDGW